jgi:protocatechuate 3,4-dioxygenase beta subunit
VEFAKMTRRDVLLKTTLGLSGLAVASSWPALAACTRTEDNDEGPFYKAGAPERSNLIEPGMSGTPLTITGRVLSMDCEPLAGAVLDVWQADASGQYDNQGFTLRGWLQTDKSGAYRLQTILPKHYKIGGTQGYRPAHVHVKVRALGFPSLTTQLYFPDDPYNKVDKLFRPSLIIQPEKVPGGQAASFDFKLSPEAAKA